MNSPSSKVYRLLLVCVCVGFYLAGAPVGWGQTRVLTGHRPAATATLRPTARVAASTSLYLAIGLPLRDPAGLTNLLESLVTPESPNFHQWLTPEQFTASYGPTEEDYAKVLQFAARHGLKVAATHPNRLIVDVIGSATQVEEAFNVRLFVYQHPTENRSFYAPDAEPSIEEGLPILHVAGLDNYDRPHSLLKLKDPTTASSGITPYATGSGPGGDFTGRDFRAAYAPGVTNTGAGQYIAIVDVGGPYYPLDIYRYETNAGFSTNIVVRNILLTGWTGVPVGPSQDDGEETLDIDMAMSMAPGATILNYEGEAHDIFSRIATDNLAKQITMSYGFGIDGIIQQLFMEFIAQGQSFFQASGDGGADAPGGTGLTGEPFATIVGGTDLTTTGPGGTWTGETAWVGSGGGSSGYGMPAWQEGINMGSNLGSTTNRNYPDVATLANPTIWWYFKNGVGSTVGGTSAASPLWAGFMALVNQAAAAQGQPSVGFLNPVVYAIGKAGGSHYATSFHDITTGNNFNAKNPNRYPALSGYDLCTGWGSPRGTQTINALLGFGTNNFTLQSGQTELYIVRGSSATTVIQVVPMNKFKGTVALSISALPEGLTATFSPPTVTTNASILTLVSTTAAAYLTTNLTVTASSGGLTNSYQLTVAIVPPFPGAVTTSLQSYFNRGGIWRDGTTFGSGADGGGAAFSAGLLGPDPCVGNIPFVLGAANANDVISCGGQIVTLPAGSFTTLQMLAVGVNGNQNNQTLTVTYADGTTAVFTQSFSDWFSPQSFPGETLAFPMPYRNVSGGVKNLSTFNVYNYTFTLDQTRTVKSLTLPHNANVVVLAITLANAPAEVPLKSMYNRIGMYTDGTTYTNTPSGGIDGSGDSYSASVLGGGTAWSNASFRFGPANALNVVSCSNQVVALPAGSFHNLKLLAAAVNGHQLAQSFKVTYTDGSSSTFSQSFSDWLTAQGYLGEQRALITGYRNYKTAQPISGSTFLYGYSVNLDATKTVQSLTLPNNANVILASISLVPNWPPTFTASFLTGADAMAGQTYSDSLATTANDLNGDALTFAKVSGPAWLNVSASGALSGTPLSTDVGTNSFSISVTDIFNSSSFATLNINVTGVPAIDTTVTLQGSSLLLQWAGGIAPYQVQMSTNLVSTNWLNVGGPISSNSVLVTPTNSDVFYRIIGQ